MRPSRGRAEPAPLAAPAKALRVLGVQVAHEEARALAPRLVVLAVIRDRYEDAARNGKTSHGRCSPRLRA
eukprot:11223361-Lingulodinium_polyedra.AAC.1